MNLIFVGSSPRAWGSEQHFVSLARATREAGHRVVAVVRVGSEVATLLEQAGVEVRSTPFRGGADPRALWNVWRAIRTIDADWIVTPHQKHFWPLYFLARLTGTKLAVFRHLVYVRSWLTRVIFPKLVDRFFVVSDFALEALVDAGAPRERLRRLYNPIELDRFRPDDELRVQCRRELGLPTTAFVVGFVGRHEMSKGIRELRTALKHSMGEHRDIHALWVGAGPEWNETRATIAAGRHTDRHHFVEWARAPERIYPALDVLVTPSLAPETFGRVVAEAQACGVPVVSSTVGGLRETFAHNLSGIALASVSADAIEKAIGALHDDERLRAKMGHAGRAYVQRFDARLVVHSFLQYLTSADAKPLRTRNPLPNRAQRSHIASAIARPVHSRDELPSTRHRIRAKLIELKNNLAARY